MKDKEKILADEFFRTMLPILQREFYQQEFKSVILKMIERNYVKHVVMYWHITDIIINGDKFLLEWKKRFQPLTEQEYKEQYGK